MGIVGYLFDPDDTMSKSYGITYGAGVVFINREGIVKSRIPVGITAERIEIELKKIL